jgi:hypothetical protein
VCFYLLRTKCYFNLPIVELDYGPGGLNNTRPSSFGTQLAASGTPFVPSKLIDNTLPADATLQSLSLGQMTIENETTAKTRMWSVVHGISTPKNQS